VVEQVEDTAPVEGSALVLPFCPSFGFGEKSALFLLGILAVVIEGIGKL